ncbi:hypothetical protein PGT21_017168 [Puccinia graminis f. sp. tritici]|uniref:Uncharacterized protein n=1 Tax=Puccinia graminis f. sp. tritici TaxID=56615 RepID=A0A5B0PN10_PUCGR|nr:hypothetical protein PGT21_017168 [Puccinia graminis f. sp. tritici]
MRGISRGLGTLLRPAARPKSLGVTGLRCSQKDAHTERFRGPNCQDVSLSLETGLIKPRARPHTRWRTPTALKSGRKRPGHKAPSPSLTTPKLVVPVPSSQEKMSPKPDGLPSNKPSTGVYF